MALLRTDRGRAIWLKKSKILGFLFALWRRRAVILATAVFVLILGTLTVFQLKKQFTANVQVMIETRKNKVTDIESVGVRPFAGNDSGTERNQVIQSGALLSRLVDKLGLDGDPEFNPDLGKSSSWASYVNPIKYLPETWLVVLGLSEPPENLTEAELKSLVKTKVVEKIKKNLVVSPVRRSVVIQVGFTSLDARKAARIANTIADLYIVDQLEAKFEATKRATNWLSERLNTLKTKVETAEKAVEKFRVNMSSQLGQRTDITAQQISGLNTQMVLAQTKRAEARARLDQIETLLKAGGQNLASAAEVLNSMLIQRLRAQEAEVIRKVSELESRYGPRHPNMLKAKNELRDLRKSIETEVRKIAQSLRNEMNVARAREATLQRNLDRLEGRNQKQNRAAIRLRELEREAKASQLLYSNFLNRFKETSSQEDLQQADARIISRASVPVLPSFPNKQTFIIVSGISGLFLGLLFAYVLERMQNSYRSAKQLELEVGIPVLGAIPLVKSVLGRRAIAKVVVEDPVSTISESIRNLSTAIQLSDVDKPPKVISVASSTPSEGKSTITLWMAQQSALSGKRVLIIDCDLRKPTIHASLQIKKEFNLVGVLAGEYGPEIATQQVGSTGLFVIPADDAGGSSLELLSSARMADLLKKFRDKYDLIYIDSPPMLAVAEARVIPQLADKVIYVVKWGATPKDLVKTGAALALDSHLPLAGMVKSG